MVWVAVNMGDTYRVFPRSYLGHLYNVSKDTVTVYIPAVKPGIFLNLDALTGINFRDCYRKLQDFGT